MIIYQDHLVRVSYRVTYQIFGNTKLKLVERRASFYWKNDSNTGQYLYYFLFTSLLSIVFLGDAIYLRHVYINNHASLFKSSFFYRQFDFVYGVGELVMDWYRIQMKYHGANDSNL
jgi:hypothetical protein